MGDLIIYNAHIITLAEDREIELGFLVIGEGIIKQLGVGQPPQGSGDRVLDAGGMIIMPALVDCHSHLLEYAATEVHHVRGPAWQMAASANLMTALHSGIVGLGEHHLGHPLLKLHNEDYRMVINRAPMDIGLASGCCFLGTDPLSLVSSTAPEGIIGRKELTEEAYTSMAAHSDYPGENIFLTATVANLPAAAAPRAGEITMEPDEVNTAVEIFHRNGKKIGAHLEGDEAAIIFIEAGGDVIHHGHGLSEKSGELMAAKRVSLVVTPHAGTGSTPTSPEEAFMFYRQGVELAIASDSCIPKHPGATWIDLPGDQLVGPADYLSVARPILDYFIRQGISLSEALKLVTLNGRRLLGLPGGNGSLVPGNRADLIICRKIPVLETVDTDDIAYVIKGGQIMIEKA